MNRSRGLGTQRETRVKMAYYLFFFRRFLGLRKPRHSENMSAKKKRYVPLSYSKRPCKESYYGSPPQLFFNEIAGFKTSSRSYLLKYGVPRHPDVTDR